MRVGRDRGQRGGGQRETMGKVMGRRETEGKGRGRGWGRQRGMAGEGGGAEGDGGEGEGRASSIVMTRPPLRGSSPSRLAFLASLFGFVIR